jgi:hypothetical protein
VIRGLEMLGLASDVRAPSHAELKAARSARRAARRAVASARLAGELDSAA